MVLAYIALVCSSPRQRSRLFVPAFFVPTVCKLYVYALQISICSAKSYARPATNRSPERLHFRRPATSCCLRQNLSFQVSTTQECISLQSCRSDTGLGTGEGLGRRPTGWRALELLQGDKTRQNFANTSVDHIFQAQKLFQFFCRIGRVKCLFSIRYLRQGLSEWRYMLFYNSDQRRDLVFVELDLLIVGSPL